MQAPLFHLSLAQLASSQANVAVGPERSRRERRAPPTLYNPSASASATPPSLAVLRARNNDFENMSVRAVQTEGKGLGVVSRRPIEAGALVAKYLTRTFVKRSHVHSEYSVDRKGDPAHVNDLFAGSFPAPGTDNVPFIGPLANEVSLGEEGGTYNTELKLIHDDPSQRLTLYGLFATRAIAAGEDITWWYGASYRRSGYRALDPRKNDVASGNATSMSGQGSGGGFSKTRLSRKGSSL